MIKQSAIGLNSRSEANPYNKDGFLPLFDGVDQQY